MAVWAGFKQKRIVGALVLQLKITKPAPIYKDPSYRNSPKSSILYGLPGLRGVRSAPHARLPILVSTRTKPFKI